MRDVQYKAIPIPETRLDSVGEKFAIFENDEAIENHETSRFLTSGKNLRTNVYILLDYSGSMYESALSVADRRISGADDPLQALYERAIVQLLDELPDHYRVGLAVFNERGSAALREIRDDGGPLFTRDKALLQQRLESIQVVDHGATQLLPALESAGVTLAYEDWDLNRLPFDDADLRAIICVTDGRLTTPPGNVTDTADILTALFVRPLFISWGADVIADPLIRIATPTGGHFYSTRNDPTGELDPFGSPIRVPVVSQLENWCHLDAGDPCDQSVPNDLDSQVAFTYITLREGANTRVEARLTFDDPNDQDGDCIEEQGEISGSFTKNQLDFESIAGDPRMGQISLHTDGVQADNSAVVLVRADYFPRNVSEIQLTMKFLTAPDTPPTEDGTDIDPPTVRQLPVTEGGIIPVESLTRAAWTETLTVIPPSLPDEPNTTYVYTYTSNDGTPLRYGDFGDLIELAFTGTPDRFQIHLEVTGPVYDAADPNVKYFTHPIAMVVQPEEFIGTSFPSPYISTEPMYTNDDPITIDLGSTEDEAVITIHNLGGNHDPTGVWLAWAPAIGESNVFMAMDPDDGGIVTSAFDPQTFTLTADRVLSPGEYYMEIYLIYSYGTLGILYESDPVWVYYTVDDPVLTLSTNTVLVPTGAEEGAFTVVNTGQSVLQWYILDTDLLPNGVLLSSDGGGLGADEDQLVLVYVDRDDFDLGASPFTLYLETSDGQSAVIEVQVEAK